MQLNLSVGEIKKLFPKAESSVSDSFMIKSLASLEKAGSSDLAFILSRGELSPFSPLALNVIKNTKAGLVIAEEAVIPGIPYLIVHDALEAFTQLVKIAKSQLAMPFIRLEKYPHAYVAQSAILGNNISIGVGAVIESGAVIGDNTEIGALTYVGCAAVIGKGVLLHPGVKVLERCFIDDYTIIHAGTVIGSDGFGFKVTMNGLLKIPQIGVVRIGKHVEIGANCSLDRASFDETAVHDFVKIDNGVHVAHNVVIGASTAILAQTGIAGSVKIGVGCQIGGQVAIKDNITVGNRVKIVSKSAVLHNLPDNSSVAGIPAVSFGQWKRTAVIVNKLPEVYKSVQQLESLPSIKQQKPFWKRFLRIS